MEKFAQPVQHFRCVLVGGRDRCLERLCLTFFCVSSYYICIFIDFLVASLGRQLGMSS